SRKRQHASCAELLFKKRFALKILRSLLASPGPQMTRRHYIVRNRPDDRNYSSFAEAARLRLKVHGIEIEIAFFLCLQENAHTVRFYCAFDSHHHCPDESSKLRVRDTVTGQVQQ